MSTMQGNPTKGVQLVGRSRGDLGPRPLADFQAELARLVETKATEA